MYVYISFRVLSHHHNLICKETEQILSISQEYSAVKYLQQGGTKEHNVPHKYAHLAGRVLTLAVCKMRQNGFLVSLHALTCYGLL